MTYKTLEERREYARQWRAKHPEAVRAADKKKRAKNPGAATERMRKWREANPDKVQAQTARQNEILKTRRATDPVFAEQQREIQRTSRAKHIDRTRERQNKWHRRNRAAKPLYHREKSLRLLYGLTLERYDQLLAAQQGRCAICSRTPAEEKHGVLHIDHCHAAGHNRGLLCTRCNTALGLFKDDPDRLAAAINYLKPAGLPNS